MKIRRETDYAMRAVRALVNANGNAMLSKEVAEAEDIPQTYILTIMCKLKNAKMVKTVHRHGDRRGGYVLSGDIHKLTLYDIVFAFEREMMINTCLRDQDTCPDRDTCTIRQEMQRINDALIADMKTHTLAEILAESKASK